MPSIFSAGASAAATPIWFVTATTFKDVRERLPAAARFFADAAGFEPKPGQYLALPGEGGKGGLGGILFGLENEGDAKDLFLPGRLPQQRFNDAKFQQSNRQQQRVRISAAQHPDPRSGEQAHQTPPAESLPLVGEFAVLAAQDVQRRRANQNQPAATGHARQLTGRGVLIAFRHVSQDVDR